LKTPKTIFGKHQIYTKKFS